MLPIPRSSGLLLHVSSLAGSPYNGDLGQSAYKFVDFLKAAGQAWWQTLPTNPYGKGFSPYSTTCSLAGEPLYIGLDQLVKDGLLKRQDIADLPVAQTKVAYATAERARYKIYRQAFNKWSAAEQQKKFAAEIRAFRKRHHYWLADFTLFQSLAKKFGTDWSQWRPELRQRDAAAMRAARQQLQADLAFAEFLQFCFFRHWDRLKSYAKSQGIGLIGDIPIFVSHGSVDVWAHQDHFLLDPRGTCRFVAGVPPDYFNKDGQLWGNALYDWPIHEQQSFNWWVKRLSYLTQQFDIIRLDHFIGFHRYWRIPANAKSAKVGRWCPAPGHALFRKLTTALPKARFIAEDLGLVTPEVWQLRDDFDIPGMRVAQFAFGHDAGPSYHMPYSCPENSVIYTGTHDNDTALGWLQNAYRQRHQKKSADSWEKVQALLGSHKPQAVSEFIKLAMMAPSALAITPAQDILHLGSNARMNIPGTPTGNWTWRIPATGVADKDLASTLYQLTLATGRLRQQ